MQHIPQKLAFLSSVSPTPHSHPLLKTLLTTQKSIPTRKPAKMCCYRTIYYTHPCGRTDSEQMVLVTCPRLAQEIQKYNSAPKTDRFAPTMCSHMVAPDTKTVPVGLPCAMVQGCCKSLYPASFPVSSPYRAMGRE